MKAKKILNFLILRPIYNKSNFATFGLVALFFGLYMAIGGKVAPLPKLEDGGSFGSVNLEDEQKTDFGQNKKKIDNYLGLTESADRQAREDAMNQRGLMHNAEEDDLEDPIDEKDLLKKENDYASKAEVRIRKMEEANKKATSMSDLGDRLKTIR